METLNITPSAKKIQTALFTWLAMFLCVVAFVRCDGPNMIADPVDPGVIRAGEPVGACHTGQGIAGDSVMGIAAYPLIISAYENKRNRCFESREYLNTVDCYSQGRDTLFTVETLCE